MKRILLSIVMVAGLLGATTPNASAIDLSDTEGPKIISFTLSTDIQVDGFARYVITVKDDKNFVKIADRISFPSFQLRNLSSQNLSPICTPSWRQLWYPLFEFKEDLSRKPSKPANNHYFFLTIITFGLWLTIWIILIIIGIFRSSNHTTTQCTVCGASRAVM